MYGKERGKEMKFKNQIDKELNNIEQELQDLADEKGYNIDQDEDYIQAVKRVTDIEWGDEPSTYRAWLEIVMVYGQVKERILKS